MRWVFGGFFSLVGLIVLGVAFVLFVEASRSADWPRVDGVVTRSAVRADTDPGSGGRASSATFYPDVAYEYEVGGERYTGTRFEVLEEGLRSEQAVAAKVEGYPVGATASVYYDPDEPGRAVLQRGLPAVIWIPFVLGAVAVAVGVAVILLMRPAGARRRRGAEAPAADG